MNFSLLAPNDAIHFHSAHEIIMSALSFAFSSMRVRTFLLDEITMHVDGEKKSNLFTLAKLEKQIKIHASHRLQW